MDKGGDLELKKVDGELGIVGRFVNQSINVWNGRRKGGEDGGWQEGSSHVQKKLCLDFVRPTSFSFFLFFIFLFYFNCFYVNLITCLIKKIQNLGRGPLSG